MSSTETIVDEQKEGKNPLLDFVEVKEAPTFDESAVVTEAKARLAVQTKEEMERQIGKLAHDETLFTDDGKFGKLPVERQQELLAAVMDFLQKETLGYIRDYQSSDYKEGIDWDEANVYIRINHMLNAAKHGVFLDDWKGRIAQVENAIRYYPGRYAQRAVGFRRAAIQDAAAEIDRLIGEIPENLTNEGLEFAPSSVGSGQKVYLDGEFVASLSGAQFGNAPTNGETVAWLTSSQIDRCAIRGVQMMWEIHVWKKGDTEPRRIYEDHAYSSERSLSLGAPNVEADGTIAFEHRTDNGTKVEKIKP